MLLGREDEIEHLEALLGEARTGTSGVLVLQGEPGIGKTTLLDYAAGRAASMRILRATGYEAETDLAFAGLYALLRPLAGQIGALPASYAAGLRRALGLESDGSSISRFAVAAGTHSLLTLVADVQPLLLLVDDMQWLDRPSQGALLFALRRLGRDKIACVLTVRSGVAAPPGLPCH